jgi:TDG/mug DNA glycosylase family protein
MRALFVGINPGIRSALTGHHFAGYSNRFWNLLVESGLVPEAVTAEDDRRLPDWGFGVTNLIPRPTPGIDSLRVDEYVVGARTLRRKVRRWRPPVMALVGVTLYRALFPRQQRAVRSVRLPADPPRAGVRSVRLQADLPADPPRSDTRAVVGLRDERFEGADLFVLPNPSGRNANYSYTEMLAAFTDLERHLARRP